MKKKTGHILAAVLAVAVTIALDQWTKLLAVTYLADKDPVPLIPGILELRYLENRGAAFGMLQQKQTFFIVMTVIVLVGIVWLFLFRIPDIRKYLPLNLVMIGIAAGAIGNFIDRFRQGYVVDFIYFRLIDFPIFNVADIFVSVSAAVLFVLLLFVYKDEDLKGIL